MNRLPHFFTAIMILLSPINAEAKDYELEKILSWNIPPAFDLGTGSGHWMTRAHAEAIDADVIDRPPDDINMGGFFVADGLTSRDTLSIALAGTCDPHSCAASKSDIEALLFLDTFIGSILAEGFARKCADVAPHTPCHSYASSSGQLGIQGGAIRGSELYDNLTGQVVFRMGVEIGGASGQLFDSTNDFALAGDPVTISITDITTGEVIRETLFRLSIESLANSQISWDETGITIISPVDGASFWSISIFYVSEWITNDELTNSSVSLHNGIFSATGIFAALPWTTTNSSVTLGPGYLDSMDFPYVIPTDFIVSDHLYSQSLDFELAGTAAEAIPEPQTWILLLVGFSMMGMRLRMLGRRRSVFSAARKFLQKCLRADGAHHIAAIDLRRLGDPAIVR